MVSRVTGVWFEVKDGVAVLHVVTDYGRPSWAENDLLRPPTLEHSRQTFKVPGMPDGVWPVEVVNGVVYTYTTEIE